MKVRVFFVFFLSLIACSTKIFAQDSTFAREIICTLSSPEMAGRNVENGGDAKAAAYLCSHFSNMNILPVDEKYYQPFEYQTFAMEGDIIVKWGNKKLSPQTDYRIADYSVSLHKKLQIVKIVPSILLEKNKKKLAKCRQKILRNPTHYAIYINVKKAQNQLSENEFQELKKTIASLCYHNPFGCSAIVIDDEKFPTATPAHGEYPRDYAVIYLQSKSAFRTNSKISIDLDNRHIAFKTQNICAIERGAIDSFIVFTAHYDHLGMMGNQLYYPGAHDNASGCAAVLDIARYFHNNPLKYNILYLLFSGEESGLLGSLFFVQNPLIDLSKIKTLINMDLICGGAGGLMLENVLCVDSGRFYHNMTAINEYYKYHKTLNIRNNAPNSDHYYFTQKNVPAIFIYTLGGRHGDYHDPNDNCDNCGLEAYEQTMSLIIKSIETFFK